MATDVLEPDLREMLRRIRRIEMSRLLNEEEKGSLIVSPAALHVYRESSRPERS